MHDYNNMTAQQRTLRQALHACLWLAACLILLLTATAGAQPAEPSIQQLLIDRVTRIDGRNGHGCRQRNRLPDTAAGHLPGT